jgi:two-component system, chemotaxis family, sensor kinase CheA
LSQSSDDRMTELRQLFFESAQELLQALNDEALKLEKCPGDVEIVRSIRRAVHTLKGDAAACGFREVSELAHEFEDALALESVLAHAQLSEVAFKAADTFSGMLEAYRDGKKLPSAQSLREMIARLTGPATVKPSSRKAATKKKKSVQVTKETAIADSAPPLTPWTEYEQLSIQEALKHGKPVYQVRAQIDPHCGMPIAGRQLIQVALASLGEILAARPEVGSPESTRFAEFVLVSDKAPEQIAAKGKVPTVVSQCDVEPVCGLSDAVQAPSTSASPVDVSLETSDKAGHPDSSGEKASLPEVRMQPHTLPVAENILRVDAERIDNVLNLVGELIIGKSMLQQAFNDFAKQFPKEAMRGKFADAMAFQARVLNDLQRSVMKIRMVPVEQLFRRFPRVIHDVARQCGKEVELILSGQDTDLDKSILDAIAEPLTHLVRNAVDHGIESAEERKRLGKSANGAVRLDAYHQGNQVIIEVSDDGRGMNPQKIKNKAIEQHLVRPEEAASLSEEEILRFIFRPGFSTASEVTEVSGRGVGMDVVQSVLNRLKGTVGVETRVGRGTTFRLKLPLTLAIIKALLFRVEEHLYAIPLNAVVEIARTVESEIHQVDNYEVLQLRNQVLSLVRLGRAPEETPDRTTRKLFVLVITTGERKFGLLVDGLVGEEELVIKALDDHAISTDLVSGASILGDGRVVLILNLTTVVEHFLRSRPNEIGTVGFGLLLSEADRARLAANPAVQS